MQTESAAPGSVNSIAEVNRQNSDGGNTVGTPETRRLEKPRKTGKTVRRYPRRTYGKGGRALRELRNEFQTEPRVESRRRLRAYIDGAFRRGGHYFPMGRLLASLAIKTRRYRPLSEKYLREIVFPLLRKNCERTWVFTRERIGRSTVWIVWADAGARARVEQIKNSPPTFRTDAVIQHSYPTDRNKNKTKAPAASLCQTGSSGESEDSHSEPPASESNRSPRTSSPDGIAPPPSANRSAPRNDGAPLPENTAHAPAARAGNAAQTWRNSHDRKPRNQLAAPFRVGARWVSGRKLGAFAVVIGCGPMREIHESFPLCRWRFAHARNFAWRALRDGHAVSEIVRAWAGGVAKSHADAAMKAETTPRQPSAAVTYATARLDRRRTREARWQQFFDGARTREHFPMLSRAARRTETAERIERAEHSEGKEPSATGGNAAKSHPSHPSHPAPSSHRVAISALRDKIAARPRDAIAITQADVIAWLAAHGLTAAQFAALSYAHRQAIISAVRAAKNNAT